VPELGGHADHVDRQHAHQHQDEEDNATTETVGQHAQRQTDQRTGQHGRGRQQTELGFVKLQQFLDRHPEHGEHHPHHETHGESEGAHAQNEALL